MSLPHPRTPSSTNRLSRRPQVEDTAAQLFHSVMSQDWSSSEAGDALLSSTRGDRHLLLVLRARIARRLINQPSPIAERAVATLNAALDSANARRFQGAAPS